MQIGIGLPTYMRNVTLHQLLDWARRAEAHGFSSIATLDRLVYANLEPLITLSAAAAVTRTIRLTTTILIAPYRNTAVLAKQAASLDRLSNGRLVLGVGLGGRADDYEAAGVATRGRGVQHSRQLEELKRIWAGERRGFAGAIGPETVHRSGPPLLVGGESPQVLGRIARIADGWIARAGGPQDFARQRERVVEAWQTAGRSGAPRTLALTGFGLGPDAGQETRRILLDYYAYAGGHAERIASSALLSIEAIQDTVAAFESAGCDELILFPALPDAGQVDLLANAVRPRVSSAGSS